MKTNKICYICNKRGSSGRHIKLHNLPENKRFRRKWLHILNLHPDDELKNVRVCSRHFEDSDFYLNRNRRRRNLLPTAIPRLKLNGLEDNLKALHHLHKSNINKILDSLEGCENVSSEESSEMSLNMHEGEEEEQECNRSRHKMSEFFIGLPADYHRCLTLDNIVSEETLVSASSIISNKSSLPASPEVPDVKLRTSFPLLIPSNASKLEEKSEGSHHSENVVGHTNNDDVKQLHQATSTIPKTPKLPKTSITAVNTEPIHLHKTTSTIPKTSQSAMLQFPEPFDSSGITDCGKPQQITSRIAIPEFQTCVRLHSTKLHSPPEFMTPLTKAANLLDVRNSELINPTISVGTCTEHHQPSDAYTNTAKLSSLSNVVEPPMDVLDFGRLYPKPRNRLHTNRLLSSKRASNDWNDDQTTHVIEMIKKQNDNIAKLFKSLKTAHRKMNRRITKLGRTVQRITKRCKPPLRSKRLKATAKASNKKRGKKLS